ncbi:MAG: adenylosuccinate lyase [Candidatus Izemoplasmatales bacterium]|nr:adenylosuccinate lyase [Candidatus Izemoplasmatales bacterium]MDD4070352.1 adenylosuccinate lyase [Candidatus Izemoplasmatales bacterium]
MIDRYSRPKMKNIWSLKSKFDTYLKIEILNAEALNHLAIVSKDDLDKIKLNAKYSIKRVKEIEKQTKHDVIAFTRSVSESLGEEKRFIHYGLTSTDVVDTANGVLLKKANEIIKKDVQNFLKVLKKQAYNYKNTFCIGRTHGIHADITVFGLKFALWYDELSRNYERFLKASSEVEVGKISGAVGNYAFVDTEIERYICNSLGLNTVNISTQTLQRDRHAFYLSTLVLLASTLEKIALEIRHLQRTEVSEVREPFSSNQKGSSAMPHKKNPIVSENITGITRVLRGYMMSTYEDIALWHERDISHSSVERIILPDATILVDYMFNRYINVIENLVVYPDNMKKNIYLTNGIIFSQRILTKLLDKGLSREDAYDKIQKLATKSFEERLDFETLVKNDSFINQFLSDEDIIESFQLDFYGRKVDFIYKKVFSKKI